MLDFIVDEALCIRCKECVRDCPSRIIEMGEHGVPSIKEGGEARCIQCQHCLAICPTAAVSILGKKPDDSVSLKDTTPPPLDDVERLVYGRRTMRRYKPEAVAPELIQRLLDGAAHAPTGANQRALTFTVIDDRAVMKAMRARVMETLQAAIEAGSVPEQAAYLHAAVPAFYKYRADLMFRGAPHLLMVSASPEALCPNEDVTIALSTFEMLATAAGLGTTWCGMLKMALESVPELKEIFGLAEDHTYYAMLFGIPAVTYARAVQRRGSASICRLTNVR